MSYSFKVRLKDTRFAGQEVTMFDMKGDKKILSSDYKEIIIAYNDNTLYLQAVDQKANEIVYGKLFTLNSISDIFWALLSMEADGVVEIKDNEPLAILKKLLT